MANKKRTDDRHKSNRMARIRPHLAAQLDQMAARNSTDFTEEVNRAIREYLERNSLWPPPPHPPAG